MTGFKDSNRDNKDSQQMASASTTPNATAVAQSRSVWSNWVAEFRRILPAPALAIVSALVILRIVDGWLVIPVVTAQVVFLVLIVYHWLPRPNVN